MPPDHQALTAVNSLQVLQPLNLTSRLQIKNQDKMLLSLHPKRHSHYRPKKYINSIMYDIIIDLCYQSNSSNGIAQTSAIKQPGQQDKDCIEILELRYFPNNKTTLNFNDFCHYFNECITNKDLQEDLL